MQYTNNDTLGSTDMTPLKIALLYPPSDVPGKIPLITQNRQFKYTVSNEIRIYPLIMSSLATMLNARGHNVLFLDSVTKRFSADTVSGMLRSFDPQMIIIETKTPLVHSHLEYARQIKTFINAKILFVGDHCGFFYPDMLADPAADYIAVSGYYDFIISAWIDGGMKTLPGGLFTKDNSGQITGTEKIAQYNLDDAPFLNRSLTNFQEYGEAYLYKPAAYILSGRGCGGAACPEDRLVSSRPGKCSFCIWQYSFWNTQARLRSPELFAAELEKLYTDYKIAEVFDDNESGGIWSEYWLEKLLGELERRKLLGKFYLSSNARADSLTLSRVKLLSRIGYRLLKVGLESASDTTLQKICKDETFSAIRSGVINAKKAGLSVLLTTMVGYPWETAADAERTYRETKKLMLTHTHFGDSLQSSIVVPYPGTPLWNYASKNGYLTEDAADYRKYDMEHAVLRTGIDTTYWCRKMWRIHLHPLFILKSFFSLRRFADIRLAFTGLLSLFGHLRDYNKPEKPI